VVLSDICGITEALFHCSGLWPEWMDLVAKPLGWTL